MTTDIDLALMIWGYMQLHQKVVKSDVIIAGGCTDIFVANYASQLYLSGMAPKLLFTGGFGRHTQTRFARSEAETFADVARQKGVPEQDILIESNSTNTGENMTFSAQLLDSKGVKAESLIFVQKPYMERRILATFESQWPHPQPKIIVASYPESFTEYSKRYSKAWVINAMIGDLQRIKEYPKMGLQSEQAIPDNVWGAFKKLVNLGYTKELIKD